MTRLRDLGRWSGGNTPSKANNEYWTNGTVPWVSPKDMKFDEITRSEDLISQSALAQGRVSLLPAGSVLIVTRSGILSHTLPVAVTKLPVTINQDIKALTLNAGISAKYVAHALRGSSQRILRQCAKHGTTVASVDTNALLDFEIPMVGFNAQEAVVAELEKQFSRLDEAVANLQRVKANLKRYKASVLKAAVEGRLVETEASLAHREGRTYETGEQLLQRILEERRAQWTGKRKYKEPEYPVVEDFNLLSEGWVYATAEQMCDQIASGSTPSPEAMFSRAGEVPFLKVYNLTFDGSLDFTVKPTFVSNVTHQGMLARSRLIPGDVLMNIVGPPLGKVSIVPTAYPEWNINQAIVTFRTSSGFINRLLAHWLLAQPVLSRLERTAKATAGQHNLQVSTCRKLPVPVPPLTEQIRIVAEVDRHLSIVREVEAEVDTNLKRAQALRQSTLAKAFATT
jgi:type I restriction enzyme S subunit